MIEDPAQEFEDIKVLFDLYKFDTQDSDLSHLYSTCFYTRDLAVSQQFKIRLFQNLAKRAIQNQELLSKSQRGGPTSLNPESVKSFVENKKLKRMNMQLSAKCE